MLIESAQAVLLSESGGGAGVAGGAGGVVTADASVFFTVGVVAVFVVSVGVVEVVAVVEAPATTVSFSPPPHKSRPDPVAMSAAARVLPMMILRVFVVRAIFRLPFLIWFDNIDRALPRLCLFRAFDLLLLPDTTENCLIYYDVGKIACIAWRVMRVLMPGMSWYSS
jgi:hypothetical protein